MILDRVWDVANQELVDAEVHYEIGHQHLDDYDDLWMPEFVRLDMLREADPARYDFDIEDAHWSWRGKAERALPARFSFLCALTVGGRTEGLMIVSGRIRSRLNAAVRVPYLAYLSTAPWNRGLAGEPASYKGVGTILMSHAISYSRDAGCQGALGLHALRGAERWYERIGMIDCGQDDRYQSLKYYEFDADGANRFISEP